MEEDPKNIVKEIIENSKKLNSKVFTLTRCILLTLMRFNEDGLQFRELKTMLNISDGKLKSNLDYLQDLDYITKVPIKLDQKSMHIYMINDSGKNELKKIIEWMGNIKQVEDIYNGSNSS